MISYSNITKSTRTISTNIFIEFLHFCHLLKEALEHPGSDDSIPQIGEKNHHQIIFGFSTDSIHLSKLYCFRS
ncbi:hypothetical protein L1987_65524 [Smallanthus sonchifolius]|uniref:Uncharacterized protein n=1 Tax=Smallanthus sonchifolius TaxID=185202 RepID=A0ACB9BUK2_9ASTR|nr:hypothetical protein L1987_65524 [Smallanthus sonchifolius]